MTQRPQPSWPSVVGVAITLICGVGVVAVATPAQADPPAPSTPAKPSKASERPSDPVSAAIAEAKKTHQPVIVSTLTDEYSTTSATPDGTLTKLAASLPQRVSQGGKWMPIDTTLIKQEDGNYQAKAALNTVTISGGGSTDLITMRDGSRALKFSWPEKLPRPTVAHDTATFPDVFPDVDLQITADATGYSSIFVVKNAEAAANPDLHQLEFGLAGTGVKIAETTNGGAAATATESGAEVFRTDTALMWDSSPVKGDHAAPAVTPAEAAADPIAARAAATELGGKQANIKIDIEQGKQILTLDKTLLTGKGTTYPVYVDPYWSGGSKGSQLNWARISSNGWNVYNSTSKTGATRARFGLDDWTGGAGEKARTYYNMNTADIRGAEVSAATLYVTHTWSASCYNTAAVVYATKSVSKWNSSGLSWGHEPNKATGVLSTVNGGRVNCNTKSEKVSPPTLAFNVLNYAKTAIRNDKLSSLTFRVEAKDMNDKYSWKQLAYGGGATLSIKYSYRPYLLNGTGNPVVKPGITNLGKLVTTTQTPTLYAYGANRTVAGISEKVRIQYQIYNTARTTRLHTGTSGFFANGAAWRTPSLPDGEYSWRATVQNESLLWSNTYTAWQNFVVDTKAPTAPTISSSQFPPNQIGGQYSEVGAWALANDRRNNVVGYLFSLDGDLSNVVYSTNKGTQWVAGTTIKPGTIYFAKSDNGNGTGTAVLNGSAAPVFAPLTPGAHTLKAKTVDQGGSSSLQTTYSFNAGTTAPTYATGEKLYSGFAAPNTDGSLTTVPAATTSSKTGRVLSLAQAAGYYFASGYQVALSNASNTSKVAIDDTATVSFNLPKSGLWDIGANLTMAPDYGTYSLTLDKDQPSETVLIDNFDAYGSPTTTKYVNFGTIKTAAGAPRSLSQGVHTITIRILGKNASSIGYQAGIDVLRLGAALSCSLDNTAGCLNNIAISTYTGGATPKVTTADADGSGYSFESADLKAKGWAPGATISVNGAAIKLPAAYGNGSADNMLASGQLITVPATGVLNKGNALVLVGFGTSAGTGGYAGATGTINYGPNSCSMNSQPYRIDNAADWTRVPTSDAVLSFGRRNHKTATQQAANLAMFAVSVPLLCPGAVVDSITLPIVSNVAQSGVVSLHFFGLGIRPASTTSSAKWVGTWAAAQDTGAVFDNVTYQNSTLNAQTIRIPATLSIGTGGNTEQVRVRLANSLGATPVTLDAVSIAEQDATVAGAKAASTPAQLTFGGARSITLPAGADTTSDPIALSLPQLTTVLVSVRVSGNLPTLAGHRDAKAPIWITAADGVDHTKDAGADSFARASMNGIPFLSGIDVTTSATAPAGALALFGDQTINGDTTSEDGKGQLNAHLARIFAEDDDTAQKVPFGILNLGSSSWGNRSPLPTSTLELGTNAKAQVDRALLNQSNVRMALLSAGASDLLACTATTAEECAAVVQKKLTSIASQLHQYKTDDASSGSVKLPNPTGAMKVYAATIPPYAAAPTTLQEEARLLVNDYILGGLEGYADGIINFSEAVSAGVAEGSTATYDSVMTDYLYADGTKLYPSKVYYEILAWEYIVDADKTDWAIDDQSGGTTDGSESIAVWEFNDNQGTTALDTGIGTGSSRTLHPARLTDVRWGKGRIVGSGAGTFNGTSSYGTTDLKPNTTANYTVAAWVKLTDDSVDRTVFARGSSGNASLNLTYQAANRRWAAQVPTSTAGDTTEWAAAESDAEAKIGVWTHLAVSYDAETSTLSLFVNGHENTSLEAVRPFNDANGATWIGRNKDTFFAGDIASVRIWARTVGEAEFQQWVAPVEVLDWELDWNGLATEAEDNSFYDHPGTLIGGASYSCPGHFDADFCALHTGGVDGAVTREAVLNTDQSFSVSTWARLEKTDANYTIASQDGEHAGRFLLQWNSYNKSWRFATTNTDVEVPVSEAADAPAGQVALNTWTHLAGVYDAAAGTLSLYVNGALAKTVPTSHSWNATGDFTVGRTLWENQKADYFPGDIDAVRVYQGAISADMVAELCTV